MPFQLDLGPAFGDSSIGSTRRAFWDTAPRARAPNISNMSQRSPLTALPPGVEPVLTVDAAEGPRADADALPATPRKETRSGPEVTTHQPDRPFEEPLVRCAVRRQPDAAPPGIAHERVAPGDEAEEGDREHRVVHRHSL